MTWRRLRITILVVILVLVALGTWLDRVYTTNWRSPLGIALYPLAADDSPASERFGTGLEQDELSRIERFFAQEARRYGVAIGEPIRVWTVPGRHERPPLLEPGSGVVSVMAYSLRLRLHAWRKLSDGSGPTPHVRIYVLFHDPAVTPALPHSLGLERGLIGIVHLFADPRMRGSNDVVLAHEILHTLGASDKYVPATGQPIHPGGYADPDLVPLHPQHRAELMGGRIPLSATEAEIPESLADAMIGPETAREIGWAAQ